MGFQGGAGDQSPPRDIELRAVTSFDFQLMTPFAYQPSEGSLVEVPNHPNAQATTTDLASVPALLWGLLPSYGKQLRAALLHDRLCDLARVEKDPSKAYADRRRADDMFLEAMRDRGTGSKEDLEKTVGDFHSRLFWAGVCYGRYWRYRKLLASIMTVQVGIGVLAIDFLVGFAGLAWIGSLPPWGLATDGLPLLLTWVACVVLSAAWRCDARVPLTGLLVGPLIFPVLLVTFVAQALLGIPDAILHLLRPTEKPPANFGPSVTQIKDAVMPDGDGQPVPQRKATQQRP